MGEILKKRGEGEIDAYVRFYSSVVPIYSMLGPRRQTKTPRKKFVAKSEYSVSKEIT